MHIILAQISYLWSFIYSYIQDCGNMHVMFSFLSPCVTLAKPSHVNSHVDLKDTF